MVIVAGTIEVDPDQRDAFLQGRADSILTTRKEPGCVEYSFSADANDPGLIRIFEIWESGDALQTHLGVLASQQGQQTSGPAPKNASVTRYEVSSSGPLF